MKRIKLLVLLLIGFQSKIYCAQEEKDQDHSYEQERQVIIDTTYQNGPGLIDGFAFLQSQGLINESFRDFLERVVPENEDENEVLDADSINSQAEAVLAANMKNRFIQTLETAMNGSRSLEQFNNPIFLYVMQHKNDYMKSMVNFWLYEWSVTKYNNGRAPLHQAAIKNSAEVAHMLIDAYADVNIQDKYLRTPLNIAAASNNLKMAQLLIDAGANINIQNNRGWTPLHRAAIYNSKEVAQLLIDAHADINIQDNSGQTAEQLATSPEMHELFTQARAVEVLRSQSRVAQLQNQCTIS